MSLRAAQPEASPTQAATKHAPPVQTLRALVLNASFEPIGVISGRRAAVLALGHKVDVLAEGDTALRSEFRQVTIPSVVRLRKFAKVPHRHKTAVTRRAIFGRDRDRCQYCGTEAENIDHVVPRSRGGKHVWTNVVACCRRCNTTKSDHLLKDTKLRLRSAPKPPDSQAWIHASAGTVPQSWGPYIRHRAA